MTFLTPTLLYAGLACIAVPIIVHLLTRRRRTPIAWGAMRFLIEAYKKHRRRLTLEQLLLLACRCAVVALLALALGKPIVSGMAAGSDVPRTLYLLIDNSVASSLTQEGTSALDRHKAGAATLLGKLDALRGDRAAVIALGTPADPVIVPPSNDLAAVGRVVASLTPTDGRADLEGGIARVAADLATAQDGTVSTIAILSEWRAGSADVERPLPAVAPAVPPGGTIPSLIASSPAETAVDNVSIVDVEPLRPMLIAGPADAPEGAGLDPTPVRVTLLRRGPGTGSAAASTLSVRAETIGAAGAPGESVQSAVRWAPGQERASVTVSVAAPTALPASGSLMVIAEIDRDALASDNVRRRPVESRPWLGVGLAATPGAARPASIDRFGPADWLRLSVAPEGASGSGSALRVIDVEPRSIGAGGALAGLDALLIPSPDRLDGAGWERVGEFVRSGGLVVVFAPPSGGAQLWTDAFLSTTGLGWSIAREARSYAPATDLADVPATSGLLALIAGEIGELARPVRVSRVLPVDPGSAGADVVLRLRDGTPLVLAGAARAGEGPRSSPARGLVVMVTSAGDLEWTDLPTKPLMVPLMQEIVRQGIGAARGVWTSEAGTAPLTPPGAVELLSVDSGETVSLAAGAAAPLRRAGTWTARDARGSSLGLLAVNTDVAGADTTPRAVSQLAPWLGTVTGGARLEWSADLSGEPGGGGAGAGVLERDDRPPISAPLLCGAAAIALIELLLARLFSHASISGAGAAAAPGKGAA